jgi:hypothetical protein
VDDWYDGDGRETADDAESGLEEEARLPRAVVVWVDGGGSAREVCLSEDDGAGVILGEDGIDGDVEVSRVATGASSEEEGWRDVDVEDVFEGRAVAFNRASVAYETGSAGRKEGRREATCQYSSSAKAYVGLPPFELAHSRFVLGSSSGTAFGSSTALSPELPMPE